MCVCELVGETSPRWGDNTHQKRKNEWWVCVPVVDHRLKSHHKLCRTTTMAQQQQEGGSKPGLAIKDPRKEHTLTHTIRQFQGLLLREEAHGREMVERFKVLSNQLDTAVERTLKRPLVRDDDVAWIRRKKRAARSRQEFFAMFRCRTKEQLAALKQS